MNPLRNIAPTLATSSNSALPVLAALGLATSALAATPKETSDLNTLAQVAPAVLEDSALTGFTPNRSGGLNCQEEVPNPTGGASARDYGPNFRVADNFRITRTGTLTQVKWDAVYRVGTAAPFTNAAPPATETFSIRILADGGPNQSCPFGPIVPSVSGIPNALTPLFSTTIMSPARAPTGATSGTITLLTVYEYTATIVGGPTLSPGQCYWIEIQNTSPDLVTPPTPGLVSLWLSGGGGGGVAGDLYAYQAPNPPANPALPYTAFNQIPQDQAFCLNLTLQSLISNPCDQSLIPPVCTNDAADGNGLVGNGSAFLSGSAAPGSNGLANVGDRTQRAENFQLAGTGAATLSSVCFAGYFLNYSAAPTDPVTTIPAPTNLSRYVVTYFENDPATGAPGALLASFAGSQITVLTDGCQTSISHPAVSVQRGTCYHLSIAYRDDSSVPSAFGRFAWDQTGLASDNPPPSPRDNRSSFRTITPDGGFTPPGPWGVFESSDGRFNHTFLLSAGPYVTPTCPAVSPTGACCLGVGCTVTTAAACAGAVGTTTNNFRGTGTVCNAPGTAPFTNNTTPCCRRDFTQNGTADPADIFAFLNNFFSIDPATRATADTTGSGTTDPADIFAFLNVYFAAGC